MAKRNPVFNKTDRTKLDKALRQIADLLPEFDKAEACGVDCQELRAAVQQEQKNLMAIRDNFMQILQ